MMAKSANLMIKAGDLSQYITHFIGVIRDEYINYLSHELKGVFFTTSSKVLEDSFLDYTHEMNFAYLSQNEINLVSILKGSVNATQNLFSYGIEGTFIIANQKKKVNGQRQKEDNEGILYEETLVNNKNDSKCDLIHYLSEYSIETLI
jgi:hypothetical protein